MDRSYLTLILAGALLVGCSGMEKADVGSEVGNTATETIASNAMDYVGEYDGRLGMPQEAIDNFRTDALKEGKDPDEALRDFEERLPNAEFYLELKGDGTYVSKSGSSENAHTSTGTWTFEEEDGQALVKLTAQMDGAEDFDMFFVVSEDGTTLTNDSTGADWVSTFVYTRR